MVDLKNISNVYFIGIGGIGMSALARYFHERGLKVSGYDKTATPLTRELEASGIAIHYDDNLTLADKAAQLVIYTPAVPAAHTELAFFKENNYPVLKRSDVLQLITEQSFNICVAGTHGKTTITTMTAHLLRHTGYGCNAFLGGIAANYNTNFWSSPRDVSVVEADEYDRSFLKLSPDVAVITAMDPDHLDIYGTPEAMEDAFVAFAGKVKPGGMLLSKHGLKRGRELKATTHLTYSLQNDSSDVYATNIRIDNGSYTYDVVANGTRIHDVVLHMGGMHNVENSIAAIGVANYLGIDAEAIKAAVADFLGVKRRFEYIIRLSSLIMVDDYAHHPEELRALISGAKTLYRERKCTVIFQPHLFSRTKDLAADFARSLDLADEVILLPIYPARELPMEGVTSQLIFDKMVNPNKHLMTKEEVLQWVDATKLSLLIMAGAGDIDGLVKPIKEKLLAS